MDMVITVSALGLAAAICFRISWEAYKWPTKRPSPDKGEGARCRS